MKLLGLTGLARCGKDTVANFLVHDHYFKRMAFADPLKKAVAVLFGIPEQQAFSDDKQQTLAHWGLTLRDVLQRFGTEAMRGTFGDDFWVRRWQMEYAPLAADTNVVIADVRFENEAWAIREEGGVIVHIKRPGAGLAGAAGQHASERGIQMCWGDELLENTGSLEDLRNMVYGLATK